MLAERRQARLEADRRIIEAVQQQLRVERGLKPKQIAHELGMQNAAEFYKKMRGEIGWTAVDLRGLFKLGISAEVLLA